MDHPVILFDGHCLMCSRTMRLIHRLDKKLVFRFAAQQSDAGRALLKGKQLPAGLGGDPGTVVVVDGERTFTQTDATLRVLRGLGFPYSVLGVLRLVPRFLRDGVYRWVARNRYRWFGKSEACFLPDEGIRGRFVEMSEV